MNRIEYTGAVSPSKIALALFLVGMTAGQGVALAEDSMGEPGREAGKPNPLKNVYSCGPIRRCSGPWGTRTSRSRITAMSPTG